MIIISSVGFREDYEEVLADVGCNTDQYVVNQESIDLLREALHRSRPVSISGAQSFD